MKTKTKTTKKSGKPNKGTEKLKKIVAKAKLIRKASPTKKWTACVKAASKLV